MSQPVRCLHVKLAAKRRAASALPIIDPVNSFSNQMTCLAYKRMDKVKKNHLNHHVAGDNDNSSAFAWQCGSTRMRVTTEANDDREDTHDCKRFSFGLEQHWLQGTIVFSRLLVLSA
jgi:hypothetical protein